MIQELNYGSKKIYYWLEFSKRKTLGITVTPDMEVLVKAPEGTLKERIDEKVEKHASWIIKQQQYFLGFYPKYPEKKYKGGETHLYLGRQYIMKVTASKKNEVHFKGKELHICHGSRSTVKSVLNNWYRNRAKEKFAEIAAPWIKRFEQYNVEPIGVFIQEMPTRWGSCTAQGKIILNPELIKAPKACIEYVIIHELCHLLHKHHTQQFFQLQSLMMPDYEKWKKRLESLAI